jgi:predicted nucleotidyltransferase
MDIEVAIRQATEIHIRLRTVGGVIQTPECGNTEYRVTRAFIFGSTIKGKANPNDLDLLIEGVYAGRKQALPEAKVYPEYLRRYGWAVPLDAMWEAYKWLTHGMQHVSRHDFAVDGRLAMRAGAVMIYPDFDLPDYLFSTEQRRVKLDRLRARYQGG